MATSRLPNGLTTVVKKHNLGQFILPDPASSHVFFDDFDFFLNDGTTWTITITGSSTATVANEDGGVLHLQTGGSITDHVFVREPGKSFVVENDKELWFTILVEPQSDNKSLFVLGLQDGTVANDPFTVRSGIYFRSLSGTFDIFLVTNNGVGGGETTLLVSSIDYTLVPLKLGYYFDGKDRIKAYVDDNLVGILQQPNLPTVPIGVVMASQTGESVVKDIHIDYIFAAKER